MKLRERFLESGDDELGDAELLALVLGTGTRGRSALRLSVDVLERFGSVDALAQASASEVMEVGGVGPAVAARVLAALAVGRRSLRPPLHAETVGDAASAWRLLGPGLSGLPREELHALYLDRRHRPISRRSLTRGSDAFTVVDPRQVFRPAVALGATAVILAHNHPSGDPTPSAQDRDVTRRVATAGRVLGVALLDHLVVAGGTFTSLAEQGALPRWATSEPAWTACG